MCFLKSSIKLFVRVFATFFSERRLPMEQSIRLILSLSLILILLFTWASWPMVTAKAVLTELTLVGGGALTLAALLDLLMVTFGASGMDGAVRNQASATGTQPVPYVGQLLNRYLGTVLDGIAPATWAQPIQEGLSYLANGTLYLSAAATAPIADFQRWAWDSSGGDLVSYALPLSAPDSWTVGDFTVYLSSNIRLATRGSKSYYLGTRIAGYPSPSSSTIDYYAGSADSPSVCYVVCRRHSNSYVEYYVWRAGNELLPSVAVSLYNSGANAGTIEQVATAPSNALHTWVLLRDMPTSLNALAVSPSIPSFDPAETVPSDRVIGDLDTFVGPMQQGQGTQLPLGDVVDVSSGTASKAHLFDYLHAGASAYAGTGVAQLPVTDVGTGEDQVLPLNVPLDTPIGVTGVSDGTIAGSGSLAGTDAIAGDFAGTDAYTMDLTQFFPFCIPFDLFALYQKFEAQAAAPVIDWPIPMPGGGDPVTVHLDFSVFDQLAVWVRRLELIAFAVGLMILTKNLIQGGD